MYYFILFVKVWIVALSVDLKVDALICMDYDEGQSKICPSDKNVCVVGYIFILLFSVFNNQKRFFISIHTQNQNNRS